LISFFFEICLDTSQTPFRKTPFRAIFFACLFLKKKSFEKKSKQNSSRRVLHFLSVFAIVLLVNHAHLFSVLTFNTTKASGDVQLKMTQQKADMSAFRKGTRVHDNQTDTHQSTGADRHFYSVPEQYLGEVWTWVAREVWQRCASCADPPLDGRSMEHMHLMEIMPKNKVRRLYLDLDSGKRGVSLNWTQLGAICHALRDVLVKMQSTIYPLPREQAEGFARDEHATQYDIRTFLRHGSSYLQPGNYDPYLCIICARRYVNDVQPYYNYHFIWPLVFGSSEGFAHALKTMKPCSKDRLNVYLEAQQGGDTCAQFTEDLELDTDPLTNHHLRAVFSGSGVAEARQFAERERLSGEFCHDPYDVLAICYGNRQPRLLAFRSPEALSLFCTPASFALQYSSVNRDPLKHFAKHRLRYESATVEFVRDLVSACSLLVPPLDEPRAIDSPAHEEQAAAAAVHGMEEDEEEGQEHREEQRPVNAPETAKPPFFTPEYMEEHPFEYNEVSPTLVIPDIDPEDEDTIFPRDIPELLHQPKDEIATRLRAHWNSRSGAVQNSLDLENLLEQIRDEYAGQEYSILVDRVKEAGSIYIATYFAYVMEPGTKPLYVCRTWKERENKVELMKVGLSVVQAWMGPGSKITLLDEKMKPHVVDAVKAWQESSLQVSFTTIKPWEHGPFDPEEHALNSFMGPRYSREVCSLFRNYKTRGRHTGRIMTAAGFISHFATIVCSDNMDMATYAVSWAASVLQNPMKKLPAAVFSEGDQGCGKSNFWHVLSAILGPANSVTINRSVDLTGRFTPFTNMFYICFDEICAFGTGDRMQFKGMIGDEDIVSEQKFEMAKLCKNHLNVAGTTNIGWTDMELDERHVVITHSNDKELAEKNYKDIVADWFEFLGRGNEYIAGTLAVADWLYNFDISGWDPTKIPTDERTVKNKLLGAVPAVQFWEECLQAGEIAPGGLMEIPQAGTREFTMASIYKAFTDAIDRAKVTKPAVFWRDLDKFLPKGIRSTEKRTVYTHYMKSIADTKRVLDNCRTFCDMNMIVVDGKLTGDPKYSTTSAEFWGQALERADFGNFWTDPNTSIPIHQDTVTWLGMEDIHRSYVAYHNFVEKQKHAKEPKAPLDLKAFKEFTAPLYITNVENGFTVTIGPLSLLRHILQTKITGLKFADEASAVVFVDSRATGDIFDCSQTLNPRAVKTVTDSKREGSSTRVVEGKEKDASEALRHLMRSDSAVFVRRSPNGDLNPKAAKRSTSEELAAEEGHDDE
jgi:hypothetical protein